MESRRLARELKKHEVPTVTWVTKKWPVFWRRAKGVHVWDVDGNRFLDLTSAFGVASLGHSHPKVTAAIRKQSRDLCHAMGDVHPAEAKARLCARLSEVTFERWTGGRGEGQAILCNAGFEAVEAALKTAKLFTRKRGVIAFEGAYHGLGYGALEATWRTDFRQPFLDQLGHFVEFVPYPREGAGEEALAAVEKRIRELAGNREIGAILVEPFQGRGGEVIPPAGFLPMLRRLCDRGRMLLIADEIYTGFWRTGKWFGVEHTKVVPDVVCLGKALSGTLPISACVGKSEVMGAWPESAGESLHTSTFLGNPLACAAALASLDVFESEAAGWNVMQKGGVLLDELRRRLGAHPAVKDIRGIGLMAGIEFVAGAKRMPSVLCERLLARGILALPSGSRGEVLGIMPPLVMNGETLQWAAGEIADFGFRISE